MQHFLTNGKLEGKATLQGTLNYKNRFSNYNSHFFNNKRDLWFSSIGLGTFLGDDSNTTNLSYLDSIKFALLNGINVLDTSINYRSGNSERVIGIALQELTEKNLISREEIIICSKVGYINKGQNDLSLSNDLLNEAYDDNILNPAFIEDQIEKSLANLNLEVIDIYYLHNPEVHFLNHPRNIVLKRLGECFNMLDKLVNKGKISAYGVATWSGLRNDPGRDEYISLLELYNLANSTVNNRFWAVQFPFNFLMTEAVLKSNQDDRNGNKKTLMELVESLNMIAFASAPLLHSNLSILPDEIRNFMPDFESDTLRSLQFVRSTPGITTTLVGMKTKEHVISNLKLSKKASMDINDYKRFENN